MLHFTETFGLVSKSTHLMPEFSSRTVAIMGLGLISGSLARALKASAWDGEIIAWGPREPSLKLGLELGSKLCLVKCGRFEVVRLFCLVAICESILLALI